MKNQACEPCAKRKVRCDKEEPCSNCKRRKQDHCNYVEVSPYDRIKKLETLVQSLGGDPSNDVQLPTPPPAKSQAHVKHNNKEESSWSEGRSRDPVLSEEDGQEFYLESRAWNGWLGNDHDGHASREHPSKNPFLMGNAPNAFDEVFSRNKPSTAFAERHPSQQDAVILWKAFHQRVNPFLRILFKRELKQLQTDAMHPEHVMQLTDAEHALIFSLYLISLLSLSDEDCRRDMHRPRSFLISELQTLCEEALSHTNLFCVKNITLLKAITIYLMAGIDRLSTQSLWSLMGLIVRNAEKLGIHRDGTHLGLTPFATEERRRLWWHVQHLDLALAVRSGLTPLTLMGDWDSKLPLNIEDDDINTNMTTFPEERKGLTDLSYCLFTYWVIDTQRAFLRTNNGRFELSWQSNEAVPQPMKDTLIGQLEEGLNGHFLQYCDPLKPVHMVLQILGRALIYEMKQRSLQALICSKPAGEIGEDLRGEVMDASIQSLEYNNAFHSQPSIRHFRWLTNSFFPWHAFMIILVEASQQNNTSRTLRIWELLSEMYSANPKLSHLCDDDDRRVSHAAGLVVAAWKTRHKKMQPDQWPSKPDFVVRLEAQLKDHVTAHVQSEDGGARQQETAEQAVAPIMPESILEEQVFNASFDLDFQDIDWSFWSSID